MQVSLLHGVAANTSPAEVQVFLWRLWCRGQSSEAQITMQVPVVAEPDWLMQPHGCLPVWHHRPACLA